MEKKEFNMFILEEDDIDISSSSKSNEEVVDIYSFSEKNDKKGKRSKKSKKRNSHKKESKFGKWWRKRNVWQKTAMISALSIMIIVGLGASALTFGWGYNYNPITSNPQELGFEEVIDENIINVALFGIDTRKVDSFKGNSDSIMILSLNTKTKKVKIISVMRDTFTYMDNNGKNTYGKINSAYARGGPELAIKTLNTIFGLDISEYATVNFYGMVDIIDAVGGIEAELTPQEVTKDLNKSALNFCVQEICQNLKLNSKDYYIYKSGKQKLNGVQAVAYSRIRKVSNIWGTNNDYGRTDRQRYVMEQLFNKAITLDKSQYAKLAKSLIPCSETSLSYNQIFSLAVDILLDSPTFEQTRLPQPEFLMTSPSGYGSVVYYDLEYAKDLIHAFIYDDIAPEKYIETNGIEKNDWYSKMNPGRRPSNSSSNKDTDKDTDNTTTTPSGSDGDSDSSNNSSSGSSSSDKNPNGSSSGGSSSGGSSSGGSSSGGSSSGSSSGGDSEDENSSGNSGSGGGSGSGDSSGDEPSDGNGGSGSGSGSGGGSDDEQSGGNGDSGGNTDDKPSGGTDNTTPPES